MITVRVSEEEYLFLQRASFSSGARSVSDHARGVLFAPALKSSAPTMDKLEATYHALATELESLSGQVRHIAALVGSVNGARRG